ncbi:hypothetical protein Q3G72_014016 [Acer saccharum]|nr:hypothetical protein Q3G72_014016 [Acer saccharum]
MCLERRMELQMVWLKEGLIWMVKILFGVSFSFLFGSVDIRRRPGLFSALAVSWLRWCFRRWCWCLFAAGRAPSCLFVWSAFLFGFGCAWGWLFCLVFWLCWGCLLGSPFSVFCCMLAVGLFQ